MRSFPHEVVAIPAAELSLDAASHTDRYSEDFGKVSRGIALGLYG